MWEAIGRFDWPLPEGTHMIAETHIKGLPVCYHGQSPVEAALEIRSRVNVDQIESIEVDAYKTAVMMMGADASRWAPSTRETADHSLPYCVSIALLDGKVTNQSFAPSRLIDPAVGKLMRKVKVREDQQLSNLYPEGAPGRVTIRMSSGEAHTAEIRYPTGHAKSPMSDGEVERKFHDMCGTHLSEGQRGALLKASWNLEQASDVGRDVVRLLARS
jgi:2-methylcitrate dehydratase